MPGKTDRPFHLLLVEDHYPDARFFELALKETGAPVRVTTAGDGQTAIHLLEEHGGRLDPDRPDLVMLDLNLPIVNGFEVLQHLKGSESLRSIPVVVLSTSRTPEDIERAYREGAACFITKPTQLQQYFAAIHEFVAYWTRVVRVPRSDTSGDERAPAAAALVDHGEAPVLTKDLEGTILSWSPLAEQIYGYSAEEAIGKPVSTLVPPEAADELHTILLRLERGDAIHNLQTIRLRKDGRRIRVALTISPLRDANDQIIGAATVAREVAN